MKRLTLDYDLCPVPGDQRDPQSPLMHLGTYGLIKLIFDTPPAGGFRMSSMRERFDVEDKIAEAVATKAAWVDIEDAEAKLIQDALLAHAWPGRHRDLVRFEAAVMSMKPPPRPS